MAETNSASIYVLPKGKVIQTVSASLDSRAMPGIVHLVQYDVSLPIIAVELHADSQPYAVPEGMAVNVRMKKPDGKTVYNPALGLSSDRSTVYVAVTPQMTAAYGSGIATIEIAALDEIAGTAPLVLDIDRNPVPNESIASSDEYRTVYELIAAAEKSAREAAESASSAAEAEDGAKKHSKAAEDSATEAESWAHGGTWTRPDEETDNAKYYAEMAAQEASSVSGYASAAKKSAEKAAESERNAKESERNAGDSAVAADTSATEAESWAIGGTEAREGEDTDNAKYYAERAKTNAENVAEGVRILEENADAIQALQDDLDAILAAPDAAASAKEDAKRAEDAADRAQSIAQGAKGYYPTEEALNAACPSGSNGDWAIVGSTSSVWIWNSEIQKWVNSSSSMEEISQDELTELWNETT